jgi:glyoxylase-like metal-dependent hydrolase (beta-lactamase superfamily II)
MKRLVIVTVLIVVTLTGAYGGRVLWHRYRTPPAPKVVIPPVGAIYNVVDNLYLVPSGGGNTAVFVTARGVVLVDTKMTPNWQGLMQQIRTVTDKPLIYVINTHCHGDHTAGNDFVPEGVEIIAQEETAREMKKMRYQFAGGDMRGLPTKTFTDRMTLLDGRDAVDLYYFGPAHTAGDAFVVFRDAGVMHAGDLFANKAFPIINTERGGNGAMYAETLRKAVEAIHGVDLVITGHSTVVSWTDFEDYAEFNMALLEQAKASIAAGQDEYQAVAALKLPDKFKDYNMDKAVNTFDQIYKKFGK